MKDDDGKIWLNYARDIIAQKIKFDLEKHMILKEVQDINNQAKAELVRQVNLHLDTTKSAKNIYSIYKVMEKHYNIMKDNIGVNDMLDEDSSVVEREIITEKAYKSLRPGSPYKLKELVNQKNFSPKKYITHKRVEQGLLYDKKFYSSITVNDPEELRQSILKNKAYITSPKKFLK